MRDHFRSLARAGAVLAVLSACQSTMPSGLAASSPRPPASVAPKAISEAGVAIYLPMLTEIRKALSRDKLEHLPELLSALRAVAAERQDHLEQVLPLRLNAAERRRLRAVMGQTGDAGRSAPRSPSTRGGGATMEWLDQEMRALLAEFGERQVVTLPQGFRRRVDHYIRRYNAGDLRPWFKQTLVSHDKYRATLRQVFAPYALPDSTLYVAFIESAFNPHAVSRAGAAGIWQFIPSTAKQYGLIVEPWLDQRYDPIRSSKAAAEYLQDLMLEFGAGRSALLAIAAYNAGEGRVRRELRKLDHIGQRSFWSLVEQGLLAEETREYLPKILAAAIVGKYRVDFGFGASAFDEPVDTVILHQPVAVSRLLELTGIGSEALLHMNPEMSASDARTPDRQVAFLLAVPARSVKALRAARDLAGAFRDPGDSQGRAIAYTVQPQSRWQTISAWSGVPVQRLRADNAQRHGAGLKLGEPVRLIGAAPGLTAHQHAVRRGESLSSIARRYRVRLDWLREWNGICGDHLDVGEPLVLYLRSAPAQRQAPSGPVRSPRRDSFAYTVRSGDLVSQIAQAFHVRVDELKCANGLRSNRIHPGQRLNVPIDHRIDKRVVQVKRGDTLSLIASRYGVSVQSIKTVNGLSRDIIRVGDRLTLYLKS